MPRRSCPGRHCGKPIAPGHCAGAKFKQVYSSLHITNEEQKHLVIECNAHVCRILPNNSLPIISQSRVCSPAFFIHVFKYWFQIISATNVPIHYTLFTISVSHQSPYIELDWIVQQGLNKFIDLADDRFKYPLKISLTNTEVKKKIFLQR